MSTAIAEPSRGSARGNRRFALPKAGMAGVGLLVVILGMSVLRLATGVNDLDSSNAISAAIIAAVPLLLAALGGLWSERSGVVNIGLEGMMIMGTWSSAYCAYHWGPWAGVIGAVVGGMLFGVLHAIATIYFGVDQIVSGVAINLLGDGLTKFLANRFFSNLPGGGPTQSPSLPNIATVTLPGSSSLVTLEHKHWFFISDVAGILAGLTRGVSWLTIAAVLLVIATAFILWRTPFGLRLRSCGEAPQAAETLGVNVYLYKTLAVIISGGLAGLAGGFLAMVASDGFVQGQTGGRGYIGLAAMIFGNWMPLGTALGALLFGYTQALQLRGTDQVHALLLLIGAGVIIFGVIMAVRKRMLQAIILIIAGALVLSWYFGSSTIDPNLTSTAPYVVTLLVMAFASQHLRMPAADGVTYRKGEAG